jgi:hypothetical protein
MAITTVAGVSSGLLPPTYIWKNSNTTSNAGTLEFITSWYNTGFPPAATAYTGGLTGQAITTSNAAIPLPVPPAGQNSYLARVNRLGNGASNPVNLMLIDRMWENSGLDRTLTTAQTFSSAAWPARDINQSTNGEGVYIALEVSTSVSGGSTAPGVTMSYTNSAGTAGKTGTVLTSRLNPPQGQFFPFMLAAGDTGVRSVQSVTFSVSWGTAGVLNLVAFRPLVVCTSSSNANRDTFEDAVTMAMPRLFDNTVLQTVTLAFNAADVGQAEVQITQG